MRLLLPGLLFGAALVLAGTIAYEAFAPLDPVTVETPRPQAHRATAARPALYTAPPVELFADIDARPLFSSQRKPLQDMTQANGAAAATSDFTLVGVIMGGARAVALLRSKSSSATLSAAVGDLVNGWRLTRIDATTVTLHSAGGEFVVPLDGPANRPPSAPLQSLQDSTPATSPPAVAPPAAAGPSAPVPPLTSATPQTAAATAPAKPGLPAHPQAGTIAPEALRSAPVDPSTGQPTL
jgi:general secretion pathway protein N